MSHQRILSSRFNMSLGFIPVIISIILCEFITQDMSIYIGAGVGLLFSIYSVRHRGTHVPQIILYCTTGMLLLLSVTTLFLVNYCPRFMLPFTLEISAIIPPFVIYLNRRKFLDYHMSQTQKCCKQLFAQGAEAAIVSSRVILIISLLHFLIIFLAVLVSYPLGDTTRHILFYVAPPLVFISGILFNQFGIFYFNIVMNHTVFVPIVNTKGDVMGKAIASEAINRKNDYINPVIRIAVASHGMLFLLPRPKCNVFEKDKIDLLMEGYLIYGETLEQGAHRILRQTLPTAPLDHLHFNFMYHFENEATNRLVYLFTLDLDDDSILCNKNFKGGKLWTFQQMEHNLGRNFFSSCLEYEFEHLEVLFIQEKNTRNLRKVGSLALPLPHGLGFDILPFTSNVRRNAELGLRTAVMKNILYHLIIAIRRFNEKLSLMFIIDALFQHFQLFGTLCRFNGKITMEGKALTVEAGTHDGEDNGRGPHQGDHSQVFPLCNSHYVRSRVGHSRTTGFGDHAHRMPLHQRLQIAGDVFGRRMLVQRIECQRINIYSLVHLFQKTACRAHILHDEIADSQYYLLIIRRQHRFNRRIAQRDWQKIKCEFH